MALLGIPADVHFSKKQVHWAPSVEAMEAERMLNIFEGRTSVAIPKEKKSSPSKIDKWNKVYTQKGETPSVFTPKNSQSIAKAVLGIFLSMLAIAVIVILIALI